MDEKRAVVLFQPETRIEVLDTDSASGAGGFTPFELMAEWDRALEAWLASRRSEKTRLAYRAAVEDFYRFAQKFPWDVIPNDVREWRQDMESRHWENPRSGVTGQGLSPATVAQRMAGLSSFYSYTMQNHWVTLPNGRQRPLGDRNPVLGVERPEVKPFAKASYLTERQVCQLLEAIPRHTVHGLRDYALILTYVLTGRRCREVRTLKGGDLRERGEQVQYHWTGKGKERWDLLPPPAWEAIRAYLRKAGRWPLGEEAYIFTALTRRATHLPTVDGTAWDPADKPLSGREVGRILKRHARRAGLDESQVHVHTLRHTCAELYRANGDDIWTVSKLLNHSSVEVTKGYFDHMEGHNNVTWRKVAAGLQLRGDW